MYASDLRGELRSDKQVFVLIEGESKVRRVLAVDVMNLHEKTLEVLPYDLGWKDQAANRFKAYVITINRSE